MHLSYDDFRKFIKRNGIAAMDVCPCGSGYAFKNCCLKNTSKFKEKFTRKLLLNEMSNISKKSENYWNKDCMYSTCRCDSILSHAIQKNGALKTIEPDNQQKLNRYIYTYDKLKDKATTLIQPVAKKYATTFSGYCGEAGKNHDKTLFQIIENNSDITYSKEQLYAFALRNIAYITKKVYSLLKYNINYVIKANAVLFSNKVINQSELHMEVPENQTIENQIKYIRDYRVLQKVNKQYKELLHDIETNFDEVKGIWSIKNDFLQFSEIFSVPVHEKGFVFFNTTDYGQIKQLNIQVDVKSSFLSLICLPSQNENSYDVVFMYNKKPIRCIELLIEKFRNQTSIYQARQISKMILNNNEEFYFTNHYIDNILTASEKKAIESYIIRRTEGFSSREESDINFFK